jgi:hypothetical protein
MRASIARASYRSNGCSAVADVSRDAETPRASSFSCRTSKGTAEMLGTRVDTFGEDTPNVAVTRAAFTASKNGTVDDVLARMHPEVLIRPLFRPGLSVYFGHAGVRQMIADGAAPRAVRVRFDQFYELPDGRVRMDGHAADPDNQDFSTIVTLKDGLIYLVESVDS